MNMNQQAIENDADEITLNRIRQQQSKVRDHYSEAPARFLAAWKKAIGLIGPQYFRCEGIDNYQDATHRDQVRPDHEAIERFMSVCSIGEGVFIAAVCSFYNGDWGQDLGKCFGYTSVGDIAARLDLEQLEVLAELMLNHTGW